MSVSKGLGYDTDKTTILWQFVKKSTSHTREKSSSPAAPVSLARAGRELLVKDTGVKEAPGNSEPSWRHPGGKLRELGAEALTDAELLSILISTGIKGKPAERIAEEILTKFGSFRGMANQPLDKLMDIKGLAEVKVIRIAAAFEIARRIVNEVLEANEG